MDLSTQLHDVARLEALRRTALLDSSAEEAFDRLTRLAARLLRTPIALVSLVDDRRQFFKSAVGLPEPWASQRETPLTHSFCKLVVGTAQPLIVTDARTDARVSKNLAVPDLGVIAYLGTPLVTSDGFVLGSFSVIDTQPRQWTEEEADTVHELAASVMIEVELRLALGQLRETEAVSQRRAEEAEGAQQETAAILNRITDGFAAFDREWRITYLNQAAVEMLPRVGKLPESLLGKRLWDEFPDLAGSVVEAEYHRAIAEQAPVHLELCYKAYDTWFEIRAYPSLDGLSVFFQDVTERKRQLARVHAQQEELAAANEELRAANEELQGQREELEVASEEIEAQRQELEVAHAELRGRHEDLLHSTSALQASEERFRAVFNQRLGFQGLLASDGTLLDCNQLALDAAGLPPNQVLTHAFWDTPWWDGLPESQEALRRGIGIAARGETTGGQLPYRMAGGQERVVEYLISPVLDETGRISLLTIEGHDITERLRAQERERFLRSAGEILTSSLDYELTLERVARHALPFLADLCLVDLVGADGQLQRVATAHVDASGEALLHELRQRFPPRPGSPQPAARAFRSGKTDLVAEVTDEARTARAYNEEHADLIRKINLRSHLAAPLVARARTIGVLNLGFIGPVRRYGPEEVALAEELARRVALAVDNAVLYRQTQRELAERQQAEQAVRESDARLQFALEAAQIGYWDLDLENHRAYRSLRHDQVFGYATLLPEWTYERFLEHVHSEDRERVDQQFKEGVATGQDWDFECRIQRADGSLRCIWGHGRVYEYRAGRPLRMLGMVSDITERKALEEALRTSEERFRTAVSSGCDLMYVWKAASDELEWFGNVNERLGCPAGETPRTFAAWESLLHPEEREQVTAAVEAHLRTRKPFQQEYRIRHQDGTYRCWSDRGSAVWDKEGQIQHWAGIIVDVTEQREAEARLRFLAEVSRILAESLDYDVTLTSLAQLSVPFLADFCYVDVLEASGGVKRIGLAYADPAQEEPLEVLYQRYAPNPDSPSPAGQVLRSGKPLFYPQVDAALVAAATRDPEHAALVQRLQVSSHISVPMIARGSVIGVINLTRTQGRFYRPEDLRLAEELARRAGTAVDNARLYQEARALEVALRQRAEELAQAGAAKDVFLGMLSHELRNPLAPIQNATEVLRMRGGEDEALARTRQVIERNVQHLARIVDDLLDVSRITHGKIELRRQRLDLGRVVEEAVESSRPLIEERHHRLSVSIPLHPVALEADPTRLGQVIANLLNNAAKYTEPGGRIWLTAEEDGEQAVVRVRDTGVGIPAEMLPRVFELFTQVDPTLDRSQGGLGLGLTLVRSLVELHGGGVEAHSAGPGQGSEFIVRLPAVSVARTARKREPESSPSPADVGVGLEILLVDDNVDAAETLGEVLELWGHQVHLAFDGHSALQRLRESGAEVVLLDIGLPGMNGYEVATTLRGEVDLPQPVLVALTGYGQDEDRRRTQEMGFDHHLVKPVDLDALREILDSVARSESNAPGAARRGAGRETDAASTGRARGGAGR